MRLRPWVSVSLAACLLGLAVGPARAISSEGPHSARATTGSGLVFLGVLEDIPGEYAGEPHIRAVRTVFKSDGRRWRPLPDGTGSQRDLRSLAKLYPREVTWTIAFDGRRLGAITARTPEDFRLDGNIGLQDIVRGSRVPTIGKRSMRYAGFSGEPTYRPLVAVSQPYFRDPAHWERTVPPPGLISGARRLFRESFPKVGNCRNPDENVLRPWSYRNDDIKVRSAYSSRDGMYLIEVGLTGYACDGPVEDGGPFRGQWYQADASGALRFIGTDMWLVDAGDYNNDGKSEVLFAIDAYNTGGYRIFYDDFRENAKFIVHYH